MTAADKEKLDGIDLSKYLPKSGGVMTGAIDTVTNGVDITVGPNRSNNSSPTLVACGSYEVSDAPKNTLNKYKSLIGTYHNTKTGMWFNMISVRHRNGYNDGVNYGMYLYSALTTGGNLIWNKQTSANTWQGERTLLDSANFTSYALAKDGTAEKAKAMSDGTLRSGFYVNSAANATTGHIWFRMATCKISGAYESVNTTFLITNGMSGHALLSCGIRNDGTGKAAESCILNFSARNGSTAMPSSMFRVVAINSSTGVTYELWGQISVRWNGVRYTVLDERNISGGKYNIWALESHSDADAKTAPTTGNYYVNSTDTSIANTLTDSGWIATTRDTTFTVTSTVKCRKYGQLVEVRGEVTFNSTYGSPTVCTLPAGYRPATVVQACGITPSGKQYMIKADTSGVISFGSDSGSTFVKDTTYRVDLTYLLG